MLLTSASLANLVPGKICGVFGMAKTKASGGRGCQNYIFTEVELLNFRLHFGSHFGNRQ